MKKKNINDIGLFNDIRVPVFNILPTSIDAWEEGYYDSSGNPAGAGLAHWRTKNNIQIPIWENEKYYLFANETLRIFFYTIDNIFISSTPTNIINKPQIITAPSNAAFVKCYALGSRTNNDLANFYKYNFGLFTMGEVATL